MKIGDLVKPKHFYSYCKYELGMIFEVENDFYKTERGTQEDRLKVCWSNGETSDEPYSFLEVVLGSNR